MLNFQMKLGIEKTSTIYMEKLTTLQLGNA